MPPVVRSPLDASRIAKWKLGESEGVGDTGLAYPIVTDDEHGTRVATTMNKSLAEDIVAQHNDWVVFNFG